MGKINIFQISKEDIDYGLICFSIGVFLLPSAFLISALFLLISSIHSTIKNRKENYFFKDRLNICFLLAGLIMILSALIQTFWNKELYPSNYDISLTWSGLANWLPFFWLYWAFKPFLNTPRKRRRCGLLLLTGTSPVIFSGLGQFFFNWHGPLSTLNGLIVWYQRPIEIVKGLTGVFNNQNYAGAWLNIVWPFSLALLIELRNNILKKISAYLFIFSISLSIILTYSRSAWLGIATGTLFLLGKKSFKTINIISLFSLLILIASINPTLRNYISNFGSSIIPEPIVLEFTDFQYSRISIWFKAIETIYNYPLVGLGAGSFSSIFENATGLWRGHAHNLPLELIISYGIPAGILVLVPISFLTIYSMKEVLLKKEAVQDFLFDRAWSVALFVLLLSQMVDMQYFDGRISIVLWILCSGARYLVKGENQILREEETIII